MNHHGALSNSSNGASVNISSLRAILPLELERLILETCARLYPLSIPKLMLVAWRVKEWIEPLLFNTIAIGRSGGIYPSIPCFPPDRILAHVASKPAAFIAKHVRNLMFDSVSDETANQILATCPGVQNLWIQFNWAPTIPLLASLSLKRLYGYIRPVLETLSPTHYSFFQLTHIEIIDWATLYDSPESSDIWSGLSDIPHLTHLSFDDAGFLDICVPLLQSSQTLSVVIYLYYNKPQTIVHIQKTVLPHDLRFLTMTCHDFRQDWQSGVHSGVDYWTRAEDFIAKRRSGKIDGACTACQFPLST
ncbi:hypothetical protein C8R43DRAFT_1017141 [Mycena crocata]|nr:hypothetical protein C8R43DRAFT_1017141 [Mycena crocata]